MNEYGRLPFVVDTKTDDSLITPFGGTPLIAEMFRACGAAKAADETLNFKKRHKGLTSAEFCESLLVLWAAGGERCEELDRLREDKALEVLLGHEIPAAQTARDFFEKFHDDKAKIIMLGEKCFVYEETKGLIGLNSVLKKTLEYSQARSPEAVATLDVDAKIYESDKKCAEWTYDGVKGFQPVCVLWAEKNIAVADEFRDGNVPAGAGNVRVLESAAANLPNFISTVLLRADSALYDDDVMTFCENRGWEYAISADMTPQLRAEIGKLDESAWATECEEEDASRQWAEVFFVPTTGGEKKSSPCMRRYLVVRILKKQGSLFADDSDRKHFAVVTNRSGDGLEILKWHRGKAGTIEHLHDVAANDLAAAALPSQKFGANSAWFRLNMIAFNILGLLKAHALPKELANARPKTLRFHLFNTVARVVTHARELVLRFAVETVRLLFERSRIAIRFQDA